MNGCLLSADAGCWPVAVPEVVSVSLLLLVERNKLPRKLSLKGRARIANLFDSGRRLTGDSFVCVWERSDHFAYGLFVPKRYGNAVKRNLLKRLLREAVRQNRKLITSGVTVGILPKRGTQKVSYEFVNAEIKRIFERLNRAED